MPRLFTGLQIPEDVCLDLQMMQGGIAGAKWLQPENFHLTLRFVGDIEVGLAREFAEALTEVNGTTFQLRLKGIGVFGGANPHSLYVAVEENPELKRLYEMHDRAGRRIGIPPEGRKFKPHVSLARLKNPEPRALQRWVETHNLYRSQSIDIEAFVLFSSRPNRGGGPYVVEETFDLNKDYARISQ